MRGLLIGAIGLAALLPASAQAHRARHQHPYPATLIKQEEALYLACRGGSRDTEADCRRRDEVYNRLQQLGWNDTKYGWRHS